MSSLDIDKENFCTEMLSQEMLDKMTLEESEKFKIERMNLLNRNFARFGWTVNQAGIAFLKAQIKNWDKESNERNSTLKSDLAKKIFKGKPIRNLWDLEGKLLTKYSEDTFMDMRRKLKKESPLIENNSEILGIKDPQKKVQVIARVAKKHFETTTDKFLSESSLWARLQSLLRDNTSYLKAAVENIIAFGAAELVPAKKWPPNLVHKCLIQHRVVLEARKLLHNEIPIYLQDPAYVDEDVETAKLLDMKVTKYGFNEHEAILKLNEGSFVFDFLSVFPVYNTIFEITRPAAIFSGCQIVKEAFVKPTQEAFVFQMEGEHFKIPEIPGPEASYSFQKFQEEYQEIPIDIQNLDAGDYEEKVCRDGSGGYSYLGAAPHLYIRKNK